MRRRKAGGKSAGLQKPSPSQPRSRGSAAAKETNAARLRRERDEALEHQRVTSEVLGVISNSPTDSASTLGAIAESIARLLGVNDANILRLEGDALTSVAKYGLAPQWPLGTTRILNRDWVTGRAVIDRAVVHVPDLQTQSREFPEGAAYARQYGHRTILAVPLLREGSAIGAILIRRMSVRPFTPRQIELVKNFAAQSVIAIENARLLDELRESLRQQTATANVLKAISRSAFDLQTVLDTLVKAAAVLCDAERNILFRREGNIYRSIAYYNYSREFQHYHETHPITPGRGTTVGRTALEGKTVHITDVLADKEYTFIDAQKLGQYRANLGVPLLREGKPIGALSLTRSEPRPFTDKQIKLVETFADQAVIAIENARLFDEVQARTRDLQESLQQQTATGDVLKIISRSPVDLTTVLDTLVETVARLCHADQAVMWRRRDDLYHVVAWHGLSKEAKEFVLAHPVTSGRGTVSGRAALERRPVHVSDVLEDPDYTYNDAQKLAGYRSLLSIPLLRENELIGIFSIHRTRVDPFTSKEIELASSFADQAVIAIENARLFEELRERQAELRVTFDNMGDGVAMFGADKQLAAWNRNLQEMLDLPDALLIGRPSFAELFRFLAARGEFGSADLEEELGRSLEDTNREMRYERKRPDGRVVEVRRNPVPDGGFVLIYADITERKRAEEALRLARDAAEKALRDLQTAQDRLVQTQKLASLGQLTAGIAHEIKNPLNFVNNFAALSSDLTDELSDVLEPVALPGNVRAEIKELTGTLKDNLGRVVQHGKRADSIVKNMLLHSREGSGEHRPVEINAIIEESLNLAYHGARAEKQGFNITLERDFDPEAGAADIYPQEVTRVLLNLISNGFYAATQRAGTAGDGFEPRLKAITRNLVDKVELRIRDNGVGIPPDIQEKIFNPFFTTKPAGEGTGLGLSMSHDIVVKQHGGTIEVLTEPGSFTEFVIRLPRVMSALAESGGRENEHLHPRGR